MKRKMLFCSIANTIDADAQLFLTNAGIVDATITDAINNLVIALKSYGIWSKAKAIYPFVGGTAFTHKFNLKSPLDLSSSFRLLFYGGWTHSENGAKPDGTSGYADTYFNPYTQGLSPFDNCLALYCNSNSLVSSNIDMGAMDLNSNTTILAITLPRNTGLALAYYFSTGQTNSTDYTSVTFANSLGFFVGSRISSSPTDCKLFHNGTLKSSSSTNTGTYTAPNSNIYIGNINNPYANFYSEKRYAFSIISTGLTDTEVYNLNLAVQTFQTTLSRQV